MIFQGGLRTEVRLAPATADPDGPGTGSTAGSSQRWAWATKAPVERGGVRSATGTGASAGFATDLRPRRPARSGNRDLGRLRPLRRSTATRCHRAPNHSSAAVDPLPGDLPSRVSSPRGPALGADRYPARGPEAAG